LAIWVAVVAPWKPILAPVVRGVDSDKSHPVPLTDVVADLRGIGRGDPRRASLPTALVPARAVEFGGEQQSLETSEIALHEAQEHDFVIGVIALADRRDRVVETVSVGRQIKDGPPPR